jgi:hypothetical protein
MNDEDLKLVVDYFRNKAAEMEMANLDLQLQVLKLQKQVTALEDAESDESSD